LASPPGDKEKDKEPAEAKPAATAPGGASTAAQPPEARVPGKILQNEDDYLRAIRPVGDLPDAAPGALLRAKTDPDHWVTAGVAETVYAVVDGRDIFTPIRLDKGVNAAVFPPAKELLASGYLWEENRQQLAYKPFVVVQREGRGSVIGFTADPNFRAYVDGLNVLFLNAVFRGAAYRAAPPTE
jgi:hypothetical protein